MSRPEDELTSAGDRIPPAIPESDDGADDPRVVHALETYLRLLTDGPSPDRDAFLAAHTEIAHWLAPQLSGLEFVHRATLSLSWPTLGPGMEGTPGRLLPESATLGDFRIVREIGRGGMGVVYEAEQLSLGRRVALKVLPFAAALDQAQLQRFRHEAQIAAHFHHTHIVPVYAVGCDRGVHFYAMQLVQGCTLADVIRDLQTNQGVPTSQGVSKSPTPATPGSPEAFLPPDVMGAPAESTARLAALSTQQSISNSGFFRWVAQVGVQAAEALDHAHRLGVVHRDIKPANLLIDEAGNLWVTDFGLARLQTEIGLTLSHDLLGTMRYMSPEQALGKRGVVDQRADVYALGATLYELLTLRPVFDGGDRESILRQIACDEPISLRRLNRSIPADLEIIVMKMLAKEPADRFATAEELESDLRRFLEDRAITARKPSLLQQVRKWTRRHRPVVATSFVALGLLLITSVIGLAVSNRLIRRERDQKVAALHEKEQALDAANANYRMAESHRIQAEQNFQKSLQVARELLASASSERAMSRSGGEDLRGQLLHQAQIFFEGLVQPTATSATARFQNGQAYAGLREAYATLGDEQKAHTSAREAIRLFDELVHEFPDDVHYLEQLAAADSSLANLEFNTLGDKGNEHFQSGVALWKKLAELSPDNSHYRFEWASNLHSWGYSRYALRYMEDAERHYREALTVIATLPPNSEGRRLHARVCTSLGLLLRQRGRPVDAVNILGIGLDKMRELAPEYAQVSPLGKDVFLRELLRVMYHMNLAQEQLGQWDQCWQTCGEGLKIAAERVQNVPYLPQPHLDLATWHDASAQCLARLDRRDEAEVQFQQAIKRFDLALEQFPENPDLHRRRLESLFRFGLFLSKQQRDKEAELVAKRIAAVEPIDRTMRNELAWYLANCPDQRFRDRQRALALAQQAAEDAPEDGMIVNTLGVALFRNGKANEAIAALNRSMRLLSGRTESFNTFFLAMAHWQLNHPQESQQWYRQAVDWMDKNQPNDAELMRFRDEAAAMLKLESAPHED